MEGVFGPQPKMSVACFDCLYFSAFFSEKDQRYTPISVVEFLIVKLVIWMSFGRFFAPKWDFSIFGLIASFSLLFLEITKIRPQFLQLNSYCRNGNLGYSSGPTEIRWFVTLSAFISMMLTKRKQEIQHGSCCWISIVTLVIFEVVRA